MEVIVGLLVLNVIAFIFLLKSLEDRDAIFVERKTLPVGSHLTFNFLSAIKFCIVLVIAFQSVTLLK